MSQIAVSILLAGCSTNSRPMAPAPQGAATVVSAGKKAAGVKSNASKSGKVVPKKTIPTHPSGVIPPAESGSSGEDPVPRKAQPSHPEGIISPAQ